MRAASAGAAAVLLSACTALQVGPQLHHDLTNTGPVPIDVIYVSGDLRRTAEVPGCSRIVVSVPRAEQWSLVIDDISHQSSRDASVLELEGTITLPIHFNADGGGFDAPISGAPESADPRMGTEC